MSGIRITYTGLISFMGGIIGIITGIIFTLIITRTLTPNEYGHWGIIFSVVGYFVMLQPIFSYWVTREIARKIDSGKTAVISNLGFSACASIIFILISPFIANQTGTDTNNFLFATLLIPILFLSNALIAINLGNKPHVISLGSIFFGISEIPLALFFVYFLDMGISGIVLTLITAYIVNISILFIYARDELRTKFKKEYLKKWLKLSWISLYPSIYFILGESTIVIFTLISGSVVGIAYWTASTVLVSMIAPAGLISRAVYPKLLEDKGTNFFRDNLTYLFYFGILFTSLIITFARPSLFALNPTYETAVPVVVILAIEGFLVVLTNAFQSALTGIEKVDRSANSTLRDYLKSNLFHIHTLRLIQTISYVSILIIGLFVLMPSTDSKIDLLTFWATVLLVTQIPLVFYLHILIKRNFADPFDLKSIGKFLITGIFMSIIIQFLTEQFLVYTNDLYHYLPNLFLFIVFGIGIYFVITYMTELKIKQLFNLIVREIINKNR